VIQPPKVINCQWCHKDTGYTEEGLRNFVCPPGGLKCKCCGEVFMRNDRLEWILAGD
jgi:hypothetical protein